eukprot:jgi/Psemu1/18366/gm1.18366_g
MTAATETTARPSVSHVAAAVFLFHLVLSGRKAQRASENSMMWIGVIEIFIRMGKSDGVAWLDGSLIIRKEHTLNPDADDTKRIASATTLSGSSPPDADTLITTDMKIMVTTITMAPTMMEPVSAKKLLSLRPNTWMKRNEKEMEEEALMKRDH